MKKFEKEVRYQTKVVMDTIEQTTNPFHKAILLNYLRHVHLELSGQYDKIVATDMMADKPVYRVSWGDSPAVINGKQGVMDFYNGVSETILWTSEDNVAVADWGFAEEFIFHQLAKVQDLKKVGYKIDDDDNAVYHVSSRQAFIWPYDENARLKGEHLYEDKTSMKIEKVEMSADDLLTPAEVKGIHLQILEDLEAKHGKNYWVYKP